MNYYVVFTDEKYVCYAERLFASLKKFSDTKIIYYTINFTYKNEFPNVIPIKYAHENFELHALRYNKQFENKFYFKSFNVFLKPVIIDHLLKSHYGRPENNFCFLDSDIIAIPNCDNVFAYADQITYYPLLNKACHDYMLFEHRGSPWIENDSRFDIKYCLEYPLLKIMNIPIEKRKGYVQTGVIVFNKKCEKFLNDWKDLSSSGFILDNWKTIAPYHEETVINCMLWSSECEKNLKQTLINVPFCDDVDLTMQKNKDMIYGLANPKDEDYLIFHSSLVPSKTNRKNLFFLHGRIPEFSYNYIRNYYKF